MLIHQPVQFNQITVNEIRLANVRGKFYHFLCLHKLYFPPPRAWIDSDYTFTQCQIKFAIKLEWYEFCMCSYGRDRKLRINDMKCRLVILGTLIAVKISLNQIKETSNAIFCGFEMRILVDKIIFLLIYINLNTFYHIEEW